MILYILTLTYVLFMLNHKRRANLARVHAMDQKWRFDALASRKKYLIYVTTHLSKRHLSFFAKCWPAIVSQRLFQESDVRIFATDTADWMYDLFDGNVVVSTYDNPGYHSGANIAMREMVNNRWYEGYEWVIRVNPDVIIRNDTWIMQTMQDEGVDGIFVDCQDTGCNTSHCIHNQMHTDFFAIRSSTLSRMSFQNLEHRAERYFTINAHFIVDRGRDAWLPGTGPHKGQCRVTGKNSPVIHDHSYLKTCPRAAKHTSITFIVPTKCRTTLQRTIDTVSAIKNANILIVTDNCTSKATGPKSKTIALQKKLGRGVNSAALVRNQGMRSNIQSDWVAFVDDDDTVSPQYGEYLKKYDADIVIFRMKHPRLGIVPPMNHKTTFKKNAVGISFAVKTSFYKNNDLYFTPSNTEDFYFLDRARTMGAKIVIADEIAYFVRPVS